MKNLLIPVLSAFLLATGVSAQNTFQLPSATVESMAGKKVNTSTFSNDGKPMIINFWATWCAPCKRELNAIAELYEDWQDETGVKLIAISTDDSRSKSRVAPYVNGQAWDYEIYIDSNGDLKRALNVNNIPHTFLVNGDGEVVWQHTSYDPGDELELFEKVKEIAGM
jgi:thiol-disulfide isomerase/thioredoxin